MHRSVMRFLEERVAALDLARRSVLEVGSFDVNGSPRELFAGPYLGIDMRDGPGVDQVALAAELVHWPPFGYEVVVCAEMLEHDASPWITLVGIARVLHCGGVLLLTTRGIHFPLHEHPADYWRFTREGVRLLVEGAGLTVEEVLDDPEASGVFCMARKPW